MLSTMTQATVTKASSLSGMRALIGSNVFMRRASAGSNLLLLCVLVLVRVFPSVVSAVGKAFRADRRTGVCVLAPGSLSS